MFFLGREGIAKPGQLDAESGVDERGAIVQAWKKQHLLGTFKIPPAQLTARRDDLFVRNIYPETITALISSFAASGTVNKKVSGVVFDFENIDDDPEVIREALLKEKIFLYEGNHTARACAKMAAKFPRAPLWNDFEVTIYRSTEDSSDLSVVRTLGGLSNAETTKPWDFEQRVIYLHRAFMAEATKRGVSMEKLLTKPYRKVIAAIRDEAVYATASNVNSIGLYWSSVACKTGTIWECMEKLISKGVATRTKAGTTFVKVTSCHSFVHFPKLSNEQQLDCLQKAIEGEVSLKEMVNLSLRYKCQNHLVKVLLGQVNTLVRGRDEEEISSFDELKQKYPNLELDSWMETWMPSFIALKGKENQTPAEFKDDISRLFRQHDEVFIL